MDSLWFVAFNVAEDRYRAVCYLCDWRGEPAESHEEAWPQLVTHRGAPSHVRAAAGLPAEGAGQG